MTPVLDVPLSVHSIVPLLPHHSYSMLQMIVPSSICGCGVYLRKLGGFSVPCIVRAIDRSAVPFPTACRMCIKPPPIHVGSLCRPSTQIVSNTTHLLGMLFPHSHVIGPEQGFTLPGTTVVCGDSHTATHGAFGALAFGIGTSEVEHVLATQTLVCVGDTLLQCTIYCSGVL